MEGGPWSSRGAGPEGGEMGVVIVDLSRTRALVMRFDSPDPKPAANLPEFYRIIEHFDPTKHYFV